MCVLHTSSIQFIHAYSTLAYFTIIFIIPFQESLRMDSSVALEDVTLGQQNCKVFGRLLRLWDAINVKSKFADLLISIDGILLDEHVSTIL